MSGANPLTGLAGNARRLFYAGQSPVLWQRSLASQVSWLGPARQACNWVIEWEHKSGPLSSSQPLLGTELSDLIDHWDTDRPPSIVPKRATERGNPFSPVPQTNGPKASTTGDRALTLPFEQAEGTSVKSLKPKPQTLTSKTNEALLKRWAGSSTDDLKPMAQSSKPFSPKPFSSKPFSQKTGSHRRFLKQDDPGPQGKGAKQRPTEQSSTAVVGMPSPSQESNQGGLTHWKRRVYDGLDQSHLPLLSSIRAVAKETDSSKEKNLEADLGRSPPPGRGQRVSLDVLTYLLDRSRPSSLDEKTSSQSTCSLGSDTPGSTRSLGSGTPGLASTKQQHPDLFSDLAKPGLVSDGNATPIKHTTSVKDTFASDFTGVTSGLTSPLVHPSTLASPQVAEPSHELAVSPPPPPPPTARLEPMAASLPESPLPDLRSLSTPGPTSTPERQPDNPRTPVPADEDLSLLAGKLQQILDAEARRHGINI